MFEKIAGALLALFFLSGRFSLAGDGGAATPDMMLYDVRAWTLLALVAVALAYAPPRSQQLARTKSISTSLTVAMALLLPLYVVVSVCWAIDFEMATEKMLEAGILAAACLAIFPFWRARRVPVVRHWFWIWMVTATGLMCLISCYFVDSTRMSVLGGGPNTFGRNMGLLFLGTLYLQRRGVGANWCWYPLMVLSLLMVVLSGSRGALLATSAGAFLYLLIDNRYRTRNVLAVGGLVVLVQIVLLTTEMGSQAMEMFETRVLNLTLERHYMSGREDLYNTAYELGLERPWFGQGLSGYTILLHLNYPHNLALELFCETGFVGVLLLAALLLAALKFVVRNRHRCDPAAWGAFGLLFTSAMFSGDFYDSRGVFLMAMLASQEVFAVCLPRSPSPAPVPGIARFRSAAYSPALVARDQRALFWTALVLAEIGTRMRVWLLHIGEDLPVDGAKRKFRYSYLAEALAERGHHVLRWAPTFRHYGKTHRFTSDRRVEIGGRYAIQFVHSPGYRRNVSIERLRMYRTLDRRFRQLAAREAPPDLIVAAIPSLEWAAAATDYGHSRGVPVVVDVRDLWPDVFLNAFPKGTRSVGRVLLSGYDRIARRVCKQATALTAVSPSYLEWALAKARRQKRPGDQVLPIGFEPASVPTQDIQSNLAALRDRGIDFERPICLFTGLFERSYDLGTVIEAARRLQIDNCTPVQFVFCGDGSKMPALKRQAAGLRDIHFLGWVGAPMLEAVLSASSIGLCAYADDALQSLPNKPFEYLASGLAVLSSLPGDLARLLDQHQCGLTYRAGDATSLANCLVGLFDDPDKLADMRANAYQAWSQNYRSSSIYDRFVTHLTDLQPARVNAA